MKISYRRWFLTQAESDNYFPLPIQAPLPKLYRISVVLYNSHGSRIAANHSHNKYIKSHIVNTHSKYNSLLESVTCSYTVYKPQVQTLIRDRISLHQI